MQSTLSLEALKTIEQRFKQQQGEILSFIRKLVETESPSGDEAGSRAVVNLLAEEAGNLRCVDSVERIDVPGVGQHLIVRAFQQKSVNDSVLLVGHTDTVHSRGSVSKRPWRVDDERVYGPGIFDMKASCAVVLNALRSLDEQGIVPRSPVVIVLTCDEEVGSFSGWPLLGRIAEADNVSTALVLEPPGPGGSVKTGRKGTGIFEMIVEGRAAHAGLDPEKGASAILELSRQINRLYTLADSGRGITVNVGVVRGGTRSNVVAAEASAEIDVRFSTLEEADEIAHAFSSIRPFDDRVRVTIKGGINRPPLERNEAVLSLFSLAREIAARLDFDLPEIQVGGASDGNFLAAKGISVLDGLGVSGAGAHADHEHIISSDIARRGALLTGIIASV